MTTLESHWANFKTLIPSARAAFYESQILPLVIEGFRGHGARDYALSIHSLGMSIEPVILAAKGLNAPRVVLLGTAQTLALASSITPWLDGCEVQSLEVERSGTRSVFTAVTTALEGVAGAIAFDVTGGTKAMVAALAMQAAALAAAGQSVDVYYLENTNWDAELRRPAPGGEHLVQLELPSYTS